MYCNHCGKPVKAQENADSLSIPVEKARAGDQDAVAILYEKTYSQVYYTVRSMIKDEDAALDIVQDSYMKAFSHLDRFDGNTKFLPWVKQIAANTARDWLKKKRPVLFAELESDNEEDTPVEEWLVDERSEAIPEQVIDQQETRRLIREIIEDLPEDQRAVIGMFYYEELSVKQIAAAMGASEGAVKSRLMYGRKKIEVKVRELEKKGTKLYSLAPIPFLLALFRSQKAHAAELPANGEILQNVLKSTAKPSLSAVTAKAAASKTAVSAAAGAAKVGGFAAAKIALIALTAVAVIGAGAFGISRLNRVDSETKPPETMAVATEPSTQATTEPQPEKDPEAEAQERALAQYRMIVEQADTYQYADHATPSGEYRYALVRMQQDDPVPTLLLSQETTDGVSIIRLFQYDPASDTVHQPTKTLQEGVAGVGGYRGALGVMIDGNGIRIMAFYSGSGNMTISRATLDGDTLHTEVQWEGKLGDDEPEDLNGVWIKWHDIADIAELDSWMADAMLPLDGDRVVFTGTIDQYSYEEVLALQNISKAEAEAQWLSGDEGKVFRLIVLDTPQEMMAKNIDGYLDSRKVSLIDVSSAKGLEPYDGQHFVISIDPFHTYWPSDVSLPLGQPHTGDIHVLSEGD